MRALVLAAVFLLAAPAAGLARPAAVDRTIRVTSVSISTVSHDAKPKGASKGDTITYRDRLLNAAPQFGRKKGARVGTDSGRLTFTGAHTARFDGRAKLPGGTIALRGQVYSLSNGNLVIPVVGGTGAFAHATGTLTVGTGRDHVLNVYRLTRSPLPVA